MKAKNIKKGKVRWINNQEIERAIKIPPDI